MNQPDFSIYNIKNIITYLVEHQKNRISPDSGLKFELIPATRTLPSRSLIIPQLEALTIDRLNKCDTISAHNLIK